MTLTLTFALKIAFLDFCCRRGHSPCFTNTPWYLFIYWSEKGGGGVALVHVYVLEHIVSLNYRINWRIFTKLGRDKVLMTSHICIDSCAKSAQGWIQGGAKIGPRGSLLQITSSSDIKATATYGMHSSDLESFGKKYCYFWFHWEVKFLMRFGSLFGLSHFGVF